MHQREIGREFRLFGNASDCLNAFELLCGDAVHRGKQNGLARCEALARRQQQLVGRIVCCQQVVQAPVAIALDEVLCKTFGGLCVGSQRIQVLVVQLQLLGLIAQAHLKPPLQGIAPGQTHVIGMQHQRTRLRRPASACRLARMGGVHGRGSKFQQQPNQSQRPSRIPQKPGHQPSNKPGARRHRIVEVARCFRGTHRGMMPE